MAAYRDRLKKEDLQLTLLPMVYNEIYVPVLFLSEFRSTQLHVLLHVIQYTNIPLVFCWFSIKLGIFSVLIF